MARKFYNPADQPLKFMFDGRDYAIPENAIWEPADEALGDHALGLFEATGFRVVGKDVKESIKAAEAVHTEWLRTKITAVLRRHAANVKSDQELGLAPRPDPPEIVQAKKTAKEWGLLA